MGLSFKEKEPCNSLELIVRKDRLPKITPTALAQLAIRHNCLCVLVFFSDLSKKFDEFVT
jgi:hypothetical protein